MLRPTCAIRRISTQSPIKLSRYNRCKAPGYSRCLGDSITTDHISPAGTIKADSPAGEYLIQHGVEARDFNSYGSRRGNHEVMMRGTFANIRLRNLLAPGTEGGWTRHHPSDEQLSIYAAAMRYKAEGVPLLIICGQGIWYRLIARLGGKGDSLAWRTRRNCEKFRADPSLQSSRHGCTAVDLQSRSKRRVASTHRHRDLRYKRAGTGCEGSYRNCHARRRRGHRVSG